MNGQWVPYDLLEWRALREIALDREALRQHLRSRLSDPDPDTAAALEGDDAFVLLLHAFALTCATGEPTPAWGVDPEGLAEHAIGEEHVLVPLPSGRAFVNVPLPTPRQRLPSPRWEEQTRDLGWTHAQAVAEHQHGGRILLERGEAPSWAGPARPCVTWATRAGWHVYACEDGVWHRAEPGAPWWRRVLSFWLGPVPVVVRHAVGGCGCDLCGQALEAHRIIQDTTG